MKGPIWNSANIACHGAAADLGVSPMWSGGGMPVNLLEFLATGLLMLTTPIGSRGVSANQSPWPASESRWGPLGT